MNLIVVSAFVIGFLIVIVLLCLAIADARRIRADKGAERPVANSTAPVSADNLEESAPAPAPASDPAPARAPAATAPVGVGYLDEPAPEPTPAPDRTPAPASAPAAPVGVGYLDT